MRRWGLLTVVIPLLLAAQIGASLGGVRAGADALAWMRTDRSTGAVVPLTLRGATRSMGVAGGIEARLRVDRWTYAPPSLGPFGLNLGLVPRLEGVELCFAQGDNRRTIVRAEHARWEGDTLVLDERVQAVGPDAHELRTNRLCWQRGTDRLLAPDTLALARDGSIHTLPRLETDLWLRPLSQPLAQERLP